MADEVRKMLSECCPEHAATSEAGPGGGGGGFIRCSCGLGCGSPYFHALHVEETFEAGLATGASGWPRAQHITVPGGLLPQAGAVARNGLASLDCAAYTTVAGVVGKPTAALGGAIESLPRLAELHSCATMLAFGAEVLASGGAECCQPELAGRFAAKYAGVSHIYRCYHYIMTRTAYSKLS